MENYSQSFDVCIVCALPEEARAFLAVLEPQCMTYQLPADILQFLGLFDAWKPSIARLKLPPYRHPQHKRRKITCHIKAMASGSAVRTDNPFEDVQAPVRGTIAIDMEGAAFGLVMSRHPLISWLVVKGVCDYADRTKSDAYHDYAARASALYALSFIQTYITYERLAPRHKPLTSNRAGPAGVWNVPHRRNPHFTGRDELLDQLDQHFKPTGQNDPLTTRTAALTQPRAIKGLGGIGKTQIAVEYAYRSRDQGRYTHTIWVNAASEETIIASFVMIAELLPSFSEKNETDQQKLVEAVKRWLEQCEQRWLLIFDNVDNPDDLPFIQEYLPRRGNGNTLLTTRADAVGSLAVSIEVEKMGLMEGVQFLLHRAQRFDYVSDEEINEATNVVIALDYFPLALDQAGAYIEETKCNFVDYLKMYQDHRKALHAKRGLQSTNYPDSVATTWSLSFQKVEQANPAAAELLRLCAFLAPDKIPEELIRDGVAEWTPPLQHAVEDLFAFNQVMAELLKFSLVERLAATQALSIHRLVQAVQRDMMEEEVQLEWAERVVRAVSRAFPNDPQNIATWPLCLRYLDQAQACNTLIEHYKLPLLEAANLFNRTGLYLDAHAVYAIAELLYRRALLICEQQLGTTHPNTAAILNNLAALYQGQSRFTEAEPLYQRAIEIREQKMGLQHPETATSINNLAVLYDAQGKYREAEPLYQRALAIYEQQLGAEDLNTAQCINNLALVYDAQGKYAEAEPLYQRALAIYEQQLGAEHHVLATGLNNLAILSEHQGKYAEAEPLYRRALAIYEQQLGAEHPDTVTGLNNLALFYQHQGKYAEAEPLHRRALAIREQQFGAEHPETAASLNNLALLYDAQEKYTEAEPLYQRALLICEQQLGPLHPNTAQCLSNLATLYEAQGKYTEAEPLYQRALEICEQRLGAEHPNTATSLYWLALIAHHQQQFKRAKSLYERALVIYERVLGPEHPDTKTVLDRYTSLLQEMNQGAEPTKPEEES